MKIDTGFNLFSAGFDFGTDTASAQISEAASFSVSSPHSGKINDFGEKIGGARKDLWRTRGLCIEDLTDMTDVEKDTYIRKENIWSKPDYASMIQNENIDRAVVYFMKTMRDSVKTAPVFPTYWDDDERESLRKRYIAMVSKLRDDVMSCRSMQDVAALALWPVDNGYVPTMSGWCIAVTKKGEGLFDTKLIKAFPNKDAEICDYQYRKAAVKKQFCFTEREKLLAEYTVREYNPDSVKIMDSVVQIRRQNGVSYYYMKKGTPADYLKADSYVPGKWFVISRSGVIGVNFDTKEEAEEAAIEHHNKSSEGSDKDSAKKTVRKKALKFDPLDGIKVSGFNYRHGNATSEMFLINLGFRAGEFGNWVNETERKENLNFAYDSFMNIAKALGLDSKQVTFNGELAIAFGARGHGNALAHYEPGRVVINLTRMKGAGSLGHEWCHFFDDMINRKYNGTMRNAAFMSEAPSYETLDSFKELSVAMKYKVLSHEESVKKVINDLETLEESTVKDLRPRLSRFDVSDEVKNEILRLIRNVIKECKETPDGAVLPSVDDLRKLLVSINGMTCGIISVLNYRRYSLRKAAMRVESVKADPECRLTVETDFYKDAKTIDAVYSRSGFGYWASDVELFARAGACWLKDKLSSMGIRDDYLSGHADSGMMQDGLRIVRAFPAGEERKAISAAFDKLLEEVKAKKLI